MGDFDDSFLSYEDEEEVTINVADLVALPNMLIKYDFDQYAKKFRTDRELYTNLVSLANRMINSVSEDPLSNDNFMSANDTQYKILQYRNAVERIMRDTNATTGKRIYSALKSAFLNVETEYNRGKEEDKYVGVDNPYHMLTGKNNMFDDMLTMLKNGNKFYRGSSNEYKDIQKQIRVLRDEIAAMGDTLMTSRENKRYIEVSMRAIYEKAVDYVNNRKNTALNYSPNSFKGKRIDIMKQIANNFALRLDFIKECPMSNPADTNFDFSKDYINKIGHKFESTTFNATLYSEYQACKYNLKLNSKEKDARIDYAFNENLKSREIQTMKRGFKGRDIDIKAANKYLSDVATVIENSKTEINNLSNNELSVRKETLNDIIVDNTTPKKNLQYLDDMMYETGYRGYITGDKCLDTALARVGVELIDERIDYLEKIGERVANESVSELSI